RARLAQDRAPGGGRHGAAAGAPCARGIDGEVPEPFKVSDEVLQRLRADAEESGRNDGQVKADPEMMRILQQDPEVMKRMHDQLEKSRSDGGFHVPEGASTELTPELEELLQEQDPELLKMIKEGRSPHDEMPREQQGQPIPQDGQLEEGQVPQMLTRALDQVLSSAFDQDASEVPNATSTEALVACLPQESCSSFVSQTSAGLELLLKQKRKPARKGLLAIAEAVHALSEAAKVHCGNDARGASVLGDLAVRLVERLKEKAAFEYRRLKVFKVGHVDLRERLNVFVFVWKMCKEAEDARALGKALATADLPWEDV
ncbi:unnamed protein product, partial [Prorocentrum cordatum]